MTTIRAAVLRKSDQPFVIEEVELGAPGPDEIAVRIAGTGVCHTDLLGRDPGFGSQILPAILGHEGAGVVEEVGSAVTGVKPGDHVVITFESCGHCNSCYTGAPAYCAQFEPRNLTGRRIDGSGVATSSSGPVSHRWFGQSSFAEMAIATARNLVVVDPSLPIETLGPLGCGIQTGAGAVLNEMRLRAGQSLVVFGAGAVGLSAIMAAAFSGAHEIVAVDLHATRRELALELGATRVVDGADPELVATLKGTGPGFDFSFDTTGVPSVITNAVLALKRPGVAVLVGASIAPFAVPPPLLAGRYITYVLEGSAVPQVFIPQLIEFWKRGAFPFDRLIRTYDLADINQAEADTLSGKTIKPVLLPARQRN